MKKALLLSLVFVLGLVSCTKSNETPKQDPIFKLVSKYNLNFPAEGGVGSVRYTVQYPVEGEQVQYTCESDWVTNISVVDSIVFNVEPNLDPVERTSTITVTYMDQSHDINITQKGNLPDFDVHFEAKAFNSTYYGRQGATAYNYFIILSEDGVQYESGWEYGKVYYRLDLYSDQTGFIDPTLPEGVYELDHNNTGEAGTISAEFSVLLDASGDEVAQTTFSSGQVVVKDGRIEALLTLQNGIVHYVTYSGPMEPGYPTDNPNEIYSTFDSDHTVNITGGAMDIYYRGDFYGLGCDVWLMNMIEHESGYSGEYIQFEVMVERSEYGMTQDAFLGDYEIYEFPSDDVIGKFLGGEQQNGFPLYSWFSRCEGGILDNFYRAPFRDGSVSITKSGSTYTFTFDCKDDKDNRISGSFSGGVRFTIDQTSAK